MKNLIALILVSSYFMSLTAQVEGTIQYQETVKIDIDIEGLPEAMKDMIPTSQSMSKELIFDKSNTVYKTKKGDSPEDINMESDDGKMTIKIMQDDSEEILYISLKDRKVIHQQGIMGKSFIVESELEKYNWKLSTEKIKYLDYECQKATIEEDGQFVVAWYTSQIPAQIGPSGYSGLPGAILMLSLIHISEPTRPY